MNRGNGFKDEFGGTIVLQEQAGLLRFLVRAPTEDGGVRSVPIGPVRVIAVALRHAPPTAAELEAAIAVIEDSIMPAIRQLPKSGLLYVAGEMFSKLLVDWLSVQPGQPLSLEAIEDLYARLAEVASGAPLVRLGVPFHAAHAVALLVLREIMHHAGFQAVVGSVA